MVTAIGWFSRNTRLRGGDNAALMDGSVPRLAWDGRNAGRSPYHFYDPPGVLHLWNAWGVSLDSGVRRRAVPPAHYLQRHCVSTGSARVLFDRLRVGDALVLDCFRLNGVRDLRGRFAVTE